MEAHSRRGLRDFLKKRPHYEPTCNIPKGGLRFLRARLCSQIRGHLRLLVDRQRQNNVFLGGGPDHPKDRDRRALLSPCRQQATHFCNVGCSQNYGSLLVIDYITAPNIWGSKWDLNFGRFCHAFFLTGASQAQRSQQVSPLVALMKDHVQKFNEKAELTGIEGLQQNESC